MPSRTRTVEIKLEESFSTGQWDIVLDTGEERRLVSGTGSYGSESEALAALARTLKECLFDDRILEAVRRENNASREGF
jgi:hypothetical protein